MHKMHRTFGMRASKTDQQAWAEALRALDEEPLEFWGAALSRNMT